MFKTALLVAMFCLVPFGLKAQQEERGVPGMALVQSMKPVACGEYRLIDKDLRERFLEEPTVIGFVGVNANNLEGSAFNVLIYHYQNEFTFTFVEHHAAGTACVISAGTNMDFDKEKYDKQKEKLEGSKL